ncbi:carbohydrate-binding module family 13 protein [Cucurbitaria berberidis CBS 394.84]|uniref:Carbohydrate-binding module family 13 protein n=1 Tax=Cucurbitaria berberidis CBS 394.84 TaxID=1168544 RepID=A0A9P4GAC2_9PLEO|nr:carbohydrate-binding module family 13 protein [Cucurbitaria berberidis CBS 394.84]KAF1841600.1 carbohydrate-binding module family 13 protein [Cucurbitaria berberidis CBS 394.84]
MSSRNERFQQWYITSEPSGYAFIANRFVPQPLVITASTGSNPNTDLQQAQVLNFEPNAISSQAWKITRLADGYYEIESMRYPGLVLDVKGSSSASGEKVLVYPRNNPQTPNQKWRLSKPTIDTLANYGW